MTSIVKLTTPDSDVLLRASDIISVEREGSTIKIITDRADHVCSCETAEDAVKIANLKLSMEQT